MINFEVWLPFESWNRKFQGVGGGGFAGAISYTAMGSALRAGYATASTDTGHPGGGGTATWALGHPELVVDFGYRAIHEVTVAAKLLVAAFYGTTPARSYFVGCSRGGYYQGLTEAQRYPSDYDGVVAGAPAGFPAGYNASQLWVANATLKDPAAFIPAVKYALINRAVLAACDAHDGVTDGVLEDPRRCTFDPSALLCKGADTSACLTQPQVDAVRRIYTPVTNPRTRKELYPPLERGGELGWPAVMGGPSPSVLATEFFKYFVFDNPDWDWKTFDFDRDVERAAVKAASITATPNLKAFAQRGGKVIMYHGWSDQRIVPRGSIGYYNEIVRSSGARRANDFIRLFMVPGMQHCGGGSGPRVFDAVSALDAWVEKRTSPAQIIGSTIAGDRTRPLCAYPRTAVSKGSGSPDNAANFECVLTPAGRK